MVICPSCKGKGHVFDPCSLLVFGFGWLDAIFGRNNPNAMSREECWQCKGKGFLNIKNDNQSTK